MTTAILLVLLGALSRLIPHPPNFVALGALALYSGARLPRRWAWADAPWHRLQCRRTWCASPTEEPRAMNRGDTNEATKKLGDLRNKLNSLANDGKLSTAGRDALLPYLDRIAAEM